MNGGEPPQLFPVWSDLVGDTDPDRADRDDGAFVGAVVVAAGESRRMTGVDKIFAPLLERPLISYSLAALHDNPEVDAVVLGLSRQNVDRGRRLVEEHSWHKVREVYVGGERRQDTVRIALEKLPDVEWVVVHDGARPLLDCGLIANGLKEARATGAAVAAVPVKDTIKRADPDRFVSETLSRSSLWAAQTPQVFRRSLLAAAHEAVSEEVTDDASMVERTGGLVRIFMGCYDNIKVTTPQDFPLAESILKRREAAGHQDNR